MTNDHKDTHIHTDTDLTYDFRPSFYGGRSDALHPEAFSRGNEHGNFRLLHNCRRNPFGSELNCGDTVTCRIDSAHKKEV